jgi:trigger factor
VVAKDIEALGRPKTQIKKATIQDGIEFESIVEVMPEVKLGDPTKIEVEERKVTVTDEKLEEELRYLAKMRSTFLEVARPAQEGDTAVIDFKILMNGETIEGGESKNHPVNLGEGHFVPGFEQKILGMSAGEEREFEITFPDDFGNEAMRGKKATAQVKAQAIQKRSIPELNDDFAKSVGKFKNLDELKEELRKNLTAENEKKESDRVRGEIVEKLAEKSEFSPLPEALIEGEIDRRIYDLAQMLAYQQKTLDDYLNSQKKDLQKLREDLRETAIKAVKVHLVVRQVVKNENIEADDKIVEEQIAQYLRQYENVKKAAEKVDPEELKRQVVSSIRNQKALEWLENQAKIKKDK